MYNKPNEIFKYLTFIKLLAQLKVFINSKCLKNTQYIYNSRSAQDVSYALGKVIVNGRKRSLHYLCASELTVLTAAQILI